MQPRGAQDYEIVGNEEMPYGDAPLPSSRTIRSLASSESTQSTLLNNQRHLEDQYEPSAASYSSPVSVVEEVIDDKTPVSEASSSSIWRPFWLRPAILATFCGIFFALAVALLVMLVHSQRNDGLGSVQKNGFRHLWRFGPTAGKAAAIQRGLC